MKPAVVVLGALLGTTGCAIVEESPPPVWKPPVVERWRLTERAYGAIDEPWTAAGDGAIAADAPALFFEPVFKVVPSPSVPSAPGRFGPCHHPLRIRYEGALTEVVGTLAETTLEVGGPRGVLHVVELAGSHAGIEIVEVQGAAPLAGDPGRYVIRSGIQARVRFTSRIVGRGGLRVNLVGEVGEPTDPLRETPFVAGR